MRTKIAGVLRSSAVRFTGCALALSVGTLAGARSVGANDHTPYGIDASYGDRGFIRSSVPNASTSDPPAAAIDSKGRIVVLGVTFPVETGQWHNVLLRFLPDGRPDPSFGAAGRLDVEDEPAIVAPRYTLQTGLFYDIAVDPSDRILLVRTADHDQRADKEIVMRRLTADGVLDTSFGVNGRIAVSAKDRLISWGRSPVTTDAFGNVLLARTVPGTGSPALATIQVVRWTSEGQLDPAFGGDGSATLPVTFTNWPGAIAVDADGRIVVGGGIDYSSYMPSPQTLASRVLVVRFLADGTPDPSFDTLAVDHAVFRQVGDARSLSFAADGRIVVSTEQSLVRFGADGGGGLELMSQPGRVAGIAVGDHGTIAWTTDLLRDTFVHLDPASELTEVERIATPMPGREDGGNWIGFHQFLPAPDGSVVAVGRVGFSGVVLAKLTPGGLSGGPDLQPEFGPFDVVTIHRRSMSVDFTLANLGDVRARATARLFASDDEVLDASDVALGTVRVARIDAGASRKMRVRAALRRGTSLTGKRILVEVTSRGNVPEAWRLNDVCSTYPIE